MRPGGRDFLHRLVANWIGVEFALQNKCHAFAFSDYVGSLVATPFCNSCRPPGLAEHLRAVVFILDSVIALEGRIQIIEVNAVSGKAIFN